MKPEAGQWWETSKGRRFKIIGQLQKTGHFVLDDNSGIPDWCPPMAIAECTYLPDCTGFDWVVPDHPQPAEDPDEWVILDPVKYADHVPRTGIDWFMNGKNEWVLQASYHDSRTVGDHFRWCDKHHRCRRRDLPKVEQAVVHYDPIDDHAKLVNKPEPQPQKTRVRLWARPDGGHIWFCPDKPANGSWQEIHHDAEGFYTID